MTIQGATVGYRNLAAQNVQASASAASAAGPAAVVISGSAPVVMPVSSLTSSQMRAAMDQPTIDEYAEVMLAANGWGPFPPAEAFYDGSTYWMWRGNHRRAALLQAAGKAGVGFDLLVPVIVQPGTERDAKLEGLSDNAEHGLRRTVEDKRKAVDWALSDPELSQWSNAKIAAKCRVSAPFVGERREIMQRTAFVASSVGAASTTRKYIDKHGQERVMNIGGIAASNQARAASLGGSNSGGASPASHGVGPALGRCAKCGQLLSDPRHAAGECGPAYAGKPAAAGAIDPATVTGNVSGDAAAMVVDVGSAVGAGVGVSGACALQTQFLAILDDLAEYVQITGDTAGAEVLRRGLLAALDRLSTV